MSRPPARQLLNIPLPEGARGGNVYSRIIPAEELGAFDAWTPTAFADAGSARSRSFQERTQTAHAPVPEERSESQWLEHAASERKAGYEEGYRDGMKALEAFKRTHAENMQAQAAAQMAQWLKSFDSEWTELEPHMARAVANAAARLARQVLRQELSGNPEHMVTLAREAVQTIVQSARQVELQVHPEDLPLVQQGLGELLAARGARVTADASLARGGCRVQADVASVDASLERRWDEAMRSLGSSLPLHEADIAEPAPSGTAA